LCATSFRSQVAQHADFLHGNIDFVVGIRSAEFAFATSMFKEASFSRQEASTRGRLMVTCMMAESTLVRDQEARSKKAIRRKHAIRTRQV
jgi:hypothetical protein